MFKRYLMFPKMEAAVENASLDSIHLKLEETVQVVTSLINQIVKKGQSLSSY